MGKHFSVLRNSYNATTFFFVIYKTNEIYKERCTVKHSSHYGSRYYNVTFNIEMTTPIFPLGT